MATRTMPETGFFDKHSARIEFGAPSGCWLWAGAMKGRGYGGVWVRGKFLRAHREAYEAVHGEGSAVGLLVRHKCDVRACVNPDHLEIGTYADNNRDMVERGRQVTPKGEANRSAKLTEADVKMIRETYVRYSGTHGHRGLARRFGVDHSVIGDIIRRQNWKHVP